MRRRRPARLLAAHGRGGPVTQSSHFPAQTELAGEPERTAEEQPLPVCRGRRRGKRFCTPASSKSVQRPHKDALATTTNSVKMFLVKNVLGGLSKGGQAGDIMNVIGGLIPGQGGSSGGGGSSAGGSRGGGGGGGGGGGFGGAGGILGGIINIISDAAASYKPEPPPPPRSHFTNVEANESAEVRQFRNLFMQLAGDDLEVGPSELMNILNKVVTRHQDLRTEGFSLDSCRSMVAVMDSDGTGKLGFEEFKYLWNNIKKWQCVFKSFDRNQEGFIRSSDIPAALQAAGFQLNEQLQCMLVRRYADEDGKVNFDNFISSMVRLDAMFRAFKALDRDLDGQITVSQEDWLKMTMYS